MAKALPHEQSLYTKIRDEEIRIDPFVWDTLYFYLGDYISAIHLMASFYVETATPIPMEEGRKILEYTRVMNGIVDKILHHEKIQDEKARLVRIKNDHLLIHPVVRELVTHHTGNDIYGINLVVSFYLDPAGPEPIPVEDARKILVYTASLRAFMAKLRQATHRDVGY